MGTINKKASGGKKQSFQAKGKTAAVKKTAAPAMPCEWYFMCQEAIDLQSLRGIIAEGGYEVEFWEDAGVIEIVVGEKCSVDLESDCPGLEDEYSRRFMEENNIQSTFAVSIPKDSFDTCEPIMKYLLEKVGGMFCADTDDFTPVIKQ